MSANDAQPPRSKLSNAPLGYFACKRRITILKRYQNLVRHRERWAPEMQFTTPLENDIPEINSSTDPFHRHMLIDREINRSAVAVHGILNEGGVPTDVFRTVRDPIASVVGQRQVREEHNDIISDYFRLQADEVGHQNNFELLMRMLEEGIGAYELRKQLAFRDFFNPLFWIAQLVRAPISILERAGLADDDQMRSMVLGAYGKILYILIIVLVALRVVRQGIVTWKQVFDVLIKHVAP